MDSINKNCSYCRSSIDCDDFLKCTQCLKSFHITCLKRPGTPGDLHGDVFYNFTCNLCSPLEELFIRQKLPWVMVVVLAIYNLSIQSKGLSNNEYFHWRSHISSFIDKNWNFFFEDHIKQKRTWVGTLSGILSTYSPMFFASGYQDQLTESGWWKLSENKTPKYFMSLYEKMTSERQQKQIQAQKMPQSTEEVTKIKTLPTEDLPPDNKESNTELVDENSCSRFLPYMGKKRKRNFSEQSRTSENSVQLNLMDFLAENLSSDDQLLVNNQLLIPKSENLSLSFNSNELVVPKSENLSLNFNSDYNFWSDDNNVQIVNQTDEDEIEYKPRIVQITNYQNEEENKIIKEPDDSECSSVSSQSNDEGEEIIEYEKSLFTKKPKRQLPWMKNRITLDISKNENLETISEYEEKKLYLALARIFKAANERHNIEIPSEIRILYRKLSLRMLKRQNGLKPFNLEDYFDKKNQQPNKPNILDRYYHLLSDSTASSSKNNWFLAQLAGTSDYELFESPFTSRILRPFIYRNSTYFPDWLKMLCEIQYQAIDEDSNEVPIRSTIDFCYVRPHHIAGVNSLLQQMFWPGIDMSECLTYPDFSVVALYKKLIIGCAFMVPDVTYNEAYISYMAVRPFWQRAGIASFMLYHLTQTCMGKDITLHVSATNQAICLYQKFGFKIEELALDFYEKYLPIESKHSRHAFFLRLKR